MRGVNIGRNVIENRLNWQLSFTVKSPRTVKEKKCIWKNTFSSFLSSKAYSNWPQKEFLTIFLKCPLYDTFELFYSEYILVETKGRDFKFATIKVHEMLL